MFILYTNFNKMLHQFWLVQTQNLAEILVSAEIPFVNHNLSKISAETKISDLSKISAEIWLRLEIFCESGPLSAHVHRQLSRALHGYFWSSENKLCGEVGWAYPCKDKVSI